MNTRKHITWAPVEKHPAALLAPVAAAEAQPGGLAPGFAPDPSNDMTFDGGRTIHDLAYANFFLGGWDPNDKNNIDQALQDVMTDPGLNEILSQYFEGETVTATFLRSSVLPAPGTPTVNKTHIEEIVRQAHADGLLGGADPTRTVFNFILSRGTFLTDLGRGGGAAAKAGTPAKRGAMAPAAGGTGFDRDEAADSRKGLGGYHGSVHVATAGGAMQTVYYAVGVFSEISGGVRNGIPVFDAPWKNVVATFYHELCEARTDADVEDGNRLQEANLFGWGGNLGEIGDIPIDLATAISQVIKEITLANGQVAPLQLMYSNRVHGPEQPPFPPAAPPAAAGGGTGQARKPTGEELTAFAGAAFAPHCSNRKPYTRIPVPPFKVTGSIVAYATPDSTFFVTQQRFQAARSFIGIGTYDFTAPYVADLLLQARRNRNPVNVSLLLDLDPVANHNVDQQIFDELTAAGSTCVIAPSCRFEAPVQFFVNAHEKYVVLDEDWVMVQSGNYSTASIPQNPGDGVAGPGFRTGNRDMGVAVQSPELNTFFGNLLARDMQLEQDAEKTGLAPTPPAEHPVAASLAASTPGRPPKLFPSKTFTPAQPVTVQPVLTPDNYVDVILPFLKTAKTSLFLEQQYIHAGEAQIGQFCAAIQQLMNHNPALDVRIIVAPPFQGEASARATLQRDLTHLATFGLNLGTHVKLLNTAHFTHCHNKLIIVDDNAVLISSQNWSDTAVLDNREAGLLVFYPDLAAYYSEIFRADWDDGLSMIPGASPQATFVMPAGVVVPPPGAAPGSAVILRPGDYAEI